MPAHPRASQHDAGGVCERAQGWEYTRPGRTVESREGGHASKVLDAAEGKHEDLRMQVISQPIRRLAIRKGRTQADTLVKTRTLNGPSLSLAMGGALRGEWAKRRHERECAHGAMSG